MDKWTEIVDDQTIEKTISALESNRIGAVVVEDGKEAKEKVLETLPQGAEVFTMTSETLEALGLSDEINNSGKYDSVRSKFNTMDRQTQGREMQKLGASPEWAIGSVHAVTEDGKVLIASNTGSQLSAYVYGSPHVIWVVGAQKIVKNVDEGMKRLYEYTLPLESERFNKAYGMTTGSFVSKLLIVNREVVPGRIKMLIVKEKLGF